MCRIKRKKGHRHNRILHCRALQFYAACQRHRRRNRRLSRQTDAALSRTPPGKGSISQQPIHQPADMSWFTPFLRCLTGCGDKCQGGNKQAAVCDARRGVVSVFIACYVLLLLVSLPLCSFSSPAFLPLLFLLGVCRSTAGSFIILQAPARGPKLGD